MAVDKETEYQYTYDVTALIILATPPPLHIHSYSPLLPISYTGMYTTTV